MPIEGQLPTMIVVDDPHVDEVRRLIPEDMAGALMVIAASQAGGEPLVRCVADVFDHAGPKIVESMMSIRSIDPHPQPGEGKANRPGTRYVPHQGKRECERRARQMARAK